MNKEKRNSFGIDKKKQIILSILHGNESYKRVAQKCQTSHCLISLWVGCYKQHGKLGLSFNNRTDYSGDFKLRLIKEMKGEGLSLHQMVGSISHYPIVFIVMEKTIRTVWSIEPIRIKTKRKATQNEMPQS